MRVIIAGGRDFNDYNRLKRNVTHKLSNIANDEIIIVCGEARGADSLGKQLAIEMGWEVASYPADWDKWGKAAGYKRNEQMAQNADALIAFWDGSSKGTMHMISLAEKYSLKVQVYTY